MPTSPQEPPLLSLLDEWSAGVDSDWRDRIFPHACVGLGDVCGHPLLGSHHRPIHRLPQPGSRPGDMGPLEQSGNQTKDKAVKVLSKWQQF